MVTINLYWRQHSISDTGVVWVKFYTNNERVHFSTSVKCTKKNWSKIRQRISNADPLYKDNNLIIENVLARCNEVFVKFRLKNRKMTKAGFLRDYNRPSDFPDFFAFVKEHRKKISLRNTLSTLQTHKTIIRKLQQYNPALHFDDFSHDWLDEYYHHLRYKMGNNDNTAMKNMAVLKVYIRAAVKAGYIEDYPFADWHIRRVTTSYVYLTEAELQKLMNAYRNGEIAGKYYQTLELFLFLCFSSLHIGDAKDLLVENFTETSFIYYRIKNRNKKPVPVRVPISDPLKMIYKNIVGNRKDGRVFGRLCADQTMNRYLKIICSDLDINKDISLKTGRHTFATIYLAKTKDITALKEIMGHSDIQETLIYAHVMEDR